MKMPVKVFKNRWAEPGEPNRLLFVAKLVRPTFCSGMRKKIMKIKTTLTKNPRIFNIRLVS